jgi:CarboxypepD_reg-like domain
MSRYILFLVLLIGGSPLWAQTTKRVVSGSVTCSEDGSAIPGVLVYVKGTDNFSGTQQDGMYYIELTDRDTVLIFKMEGFHKREVRAPESCSLNVTLARGSDSALCLWADQQIIKLCQKVSPVR